MELLTLKETADLLRVHPVTLRDWARAGRVPAIKLGRNWRFDKERIALWLKQQGA